MSIGKAITDADCGNLSMTDWKEIVDGLLRSFIWVTQRGSNSKLTLLCRNAMCKKCIKTQPPLIALEAVVFLVTWERIELSTH